MSTATVEPQQEYFSPEAVARMVGVTRRTVDKWITGGELTAFRAGRRTVRIHRDAIEKLMVPVDLAGAVMRDQIPSVGSLTRKAAEKAAEARISIGTAQLQRLAKLVRDDLEASRSRAGRMRNDPVGEEAVENVIMQRLDELARGSAA